MVDEYHADLLGLLREIAISLERTADVDEQVLAHLDRQEAREQSRIETIEEIARQGEASEAMLMKQLGEITEQ